MDMVCNSAYYGEWRYKWRMSDDDDVRDAFTFLFLCHVFTPILNISDAYQQTTKSNNK